MAVDVAAACSDACSASSPQGFFFGIVVVFAVYIGLDTMLSVLTIQSRLQKHLECDKA